MSASAPDTDTSAAAGGAGDGAPQGRRYRANYRYVLMLGFMAALPAFSTDMYLPSLPDVARDLHTSATAAQLTMTAMMLGGAVGQLVIGPVSDRFGRRRPVLVGVGLHVLVSALCAIGPAIGLLIAGCVLLVAASLDRAPIWLAIIGFALLPASHGVGSPNGIAIALENHGERAGSASALHGVLRRGRRAAARFVLSCSR